MLRLEAAAVIVLAAGGSAGAQTAVPQMYNRANPYDRLPPLGTDPAFDCAWRAAAFKYAQKISGGGKDSEMVASPFPPYR